MRSWAIAYERIICVGLFFEISHYIRNDIPGVLCTLKILLVIPMGVSTRELEKDLSYLLLGRYDIAAP